MSKAKIDKRMIKVVHMRLTQPTTLHHYGILEKEGFIKKGENGRAPQLQIPHCLNSSA